ncbi:hypothetical protein D3C80_1468050 [compost metagenome]
MGTGDASRLAVGKALDHLAAGQQPQPAAVLAAQALLAAVHRRAPGQAFVQGVLAAGGILRMQAVAPLLRAVADLVLGVAEQRLPRRREVQAVALQVPFPDSVADAVEGQGPALLADAQRLAVALQLGGAPLDQGQGALALAEQDEQQDAEQQAEAGARQGHAPGGQAVLPELPGE